MLALALALQLVADPAPPAPELHLVPPLSLQLVGEGTPDLAPAPPAVVVEAARRPVRFKTLAASGAGIVVADLACAVPVIIGLLWCIEDLTSYGQTGGCSKGLPLMIGGAIAFVLVPPAAGVFAARSAGERGDAAWRAYLLALGARTGALALAAALLPAAAPAVFLGVELVLTPYVIARVLASAPPLADPGATPAARALPVRNPAIAWR